ncbi:MAG: hypothetical protein KDI42_11250 [Gammaproteobacteria bacterium]|nr:hypothetical protein [Gammaproteobacteria bacterium]
MITLSDIRACSNCGSTDLAWVYTALNAGPNADGNLRINNIGVRFFLGCAACGETLAIVSAEEVADAMTTAHATYEETGHGS